MPTTPVYGFPYLSPNDPPDIAGGLQALAEAMESTLQAQLNQAGLQTGLPLTPGANWSTLVNEYQDLKIGNKKLRILHLQMQYNGTTALVGNTSSNLTPDATLATITNAADRPAIAAYGEARFTANGGTWQCTTTGVITITDLPNGANVSQNDTAQLYIPYLLP